MIFPDPEIESLLYALPNSGHRPTDTVPLWAMFLTEFCCFSWWRFEEKKKITLKRLQKFEFAQTCMSPSSVRLLSYCTQQEDEYWQATFMSQALGITNQLSLLIENALYKAKLIKKPAFVEKELVHLLMSYRNIAHLAATSNLYAGLIWPTLSR